MQQKVRFLMMQLSALILNKNINMINMRYPKYILISAIIIASVINMWAQQEEVKVVKPYNPTLSGAEKIQLLPDLKDTVDYTMPEFEYTLFPKQYETGFRITPIKPARMVKLPLDKLYKSELKAGMGNYLTPLVDLRINQLRSSKGSFGVGLRHHSMNGKVKLENDQKISAGFNENDLSVYGKRYSGYNIFEYKAGASYHSNLHYGVDTSMVDSVTKPDLLHNYYLGYAGIGFQKARPDSSHTAYKGTLDYYFFSHEFEQMEHAADFDFNIEHPFRHFSLGGDAGLTYYGHPTDVDTALRNNFQIKLNPYFSKKSDEWMFRIGINSYTEIRNNEMQLPRLYLSGRFSFNIVKDVLVPYFGVDGYQQMNTYRGLINENPYFIPPFELEPTNYRLIMYGGLKGKITDNLAWNIRVNYSSIENQYFFVTDSSELNNQFTIIYDDMTVANVHAELNIRPTKSLKFVLKGNYFNYQLAPVPHAWYKQDWDAGMQVNYNMADKILIDGGLFVIGPRYYPALVSGGNPGMLGTTVDVNLGAEYRYSNLLSFWLRFNNMTAQPYYLWYNYPSYRFRFMLGFSYSM